MRSENYRLWMKLTTSDAREIPSIRSTNASKLRELKQMGAIWPADDVCTWWNELRVPFGFWEGRKHEENDAAKHRRMTAIIHFLFALFILFIWRMTTTTVTESMALAPIPRKSQIHLNHL